MIRWYAKFGEEEKNKYSEKSFARVASPVRLLSSTGIALGQVKADIFPRNQNQTKKMYGNANKTEV